MKSSTNIPFTDFGGVGEKIHFAHANGYPPGCYSELIDLLKESHKVFSMHYRPLWDGSDYQKLRNWKSFSDDLIQFLDQQSEKALIGIGHSMGATTSVVAAQKRPDLFRKLILIEPVILPTQAYWIGILPISWRRRLFPIAKIAQKRKDKWESKEVLFESFRKKKVFDKISDKGLRLFAEHGTRADEGGGVKLLYSKQWEEQVYLTPFYPWTFLKRLQQPTLVLRAEYSNVLNNKTWQKLKETVKNGTFIDLENTSHLAPLEAPEMINEIIKNWLEV